MQTENDSIKLLAKMIKGIKFAMLTTQDDLGLLRSRPMATQETDFDGTLWFFTSESSSKVFEIRKNPVVNVNFVNPEDSRYVSISGTAEISKDQSKIKELWKPFYKTWFPEGLEASALALIKVNVEKAEYWDVASKTLIPILGFAKALLTGTSYRPSPNVNRKIELTH